MPEKEIYSDSTGIYVRFSGGDMDKIEDKIIKGNGPDGIIKAEISRVNGEKEYLFEVTGMITLAEYMEDSPKEREVVRIFEQMLEITNRVEEYLLDGRHLVFDAEVMYLLWDKNAPELKMIFFPEHTVSQMEGMAELVSSLINISDRLESGLASFLYELHRVLLEPGVTRNILRNMIEKYLLEKDESKEEVEPIMEKKKGSIVKKNIIQKKNQSQNKKAADEEKNSGVSTQKTEKKESYVLSVVFLGVGILIPVIMYRLGFFTKTLTGELDAMSLIGACCFFVAVGGYGAWRFKPDRKKTYDIIEDKIISFCLIPKTPGMSVLAVKSFPWSLGSDEKRAASIIERDRISPVHAHIDRIGDSFFVTDDDSANGTFLNEKRLEPWKKTAVKDGDVIGLDNIRYVAEIVESDEFGFAMQ